MSARAGNRGQRARLPGDGPLGRISRLTRQLMLAGVLRRADDVTSDSAPRRGSRMATVMREDERVTALELFFDLVFVLALTQCTTLMSHDPTWAGMAKGLAVLGVLWWSWGGYAWLTSVVDPEEGAVRLVMFGAMAAMLVAALGVPGAFGSTALLFACAYGVVRAAHIMLFLLASRGDRDLRRSVTGLAVQHRGRRGAARRRGVRRRAASGVLWGVALLLDVGGPFLFGAEGWKLVPGHFAERHGADHHHRPGRVDRRHRRRREPGCRRGRGRGGGARDRRRRGAVVDVLRRRRARRRRAGSGRPPRAASATRWRATRTPTSTTDGGRHRPDRARAQEDAGARRRSPDHRDRRWRCSAARRSTSWPTSPSACGTLAP